jgi:hypothetical protein
VENKYSKVNDIDEVKAEGGDAEAAQGVEDEGRDDGKQQFHIDKSLGTLFQSGPHEGVKLRPAPLYTDQGKMSVENGHEDNKERDQERGKGIDPCE